MTKRTNIQRVKAMFEMIRTKGQVFKTDFEKIGLNSKTTDDWMALIRYIQSEQRIREIKTGRYTLYEFEKE